MVREITNSWLIFPFQPPFIGHFQLLCLIIKEYVDGPQRFSKNSLRSCPQYQPTIWREDPCHPLPKLVWSNMALRDFVACFSPVIYALRVGWRFHAPTSAPLAGIYIWICIFLVRVVGGRPIWPWWVFYVRILHFWNRNLGTASNRVLNKKPWLLCESGAITWSIETRIDKHYSKEKIPAVVLVYVYWG